MTQNTEQERAEFEAWGSGHNFDFTHAGFGLYAKTETQAAWMAWKEQAARRAPVTPQQWKITEEMHVAAVKVFHRASGLDGLPQRMVDAMLAAAPQPPEADHIPDAGKMVAAPVQLPEHVYTLRIRGRLHDHTPALPAFDLEDGEHKLYTEHQVRQLLAAQDPNHGKQT